MLRFSADKLTETNGEVARLAHKEYMVNRDLDLTIALSMSISSALRCAKHVSQAKQETKPAFVNERTTLMLT